MKTIDRKLILFIFCLVAIVPLQAQKGLLWKISGNGLKGPSYLYGTIPLICPDEFKVTGATKQAMAKTGQLVLELDMDDPTMMAAMQKVSMNEEGKNISNEMTEEQKAVVNAFFQKHYGADLSQFGIMKPFALMSMMLLKSMDCAQPASYEAAFVQEAKKENKEVFGLETVEFQMGIFDKAPMEEQISWLVEYANDEEAMKKEFDQLVEAYKERDLDKLHGIIISSPEMESMLETLLYNRNKNWIHKIADYAHEKPTFFAVGAGHLASGKGVIALLKKEGYKVKAVE